MADENTAPSFILKLDNTRLAPEKEASVKEITVINKINDPSKFMILLSDPDGEWIDSDDIKIGVKTEISLGFKDNVSVVIKGEITGITAEFSRIFGRTVLVTGYDAIHKLGKVKTTRSFLEKSYSDAIKEMIQDRSLQCDVCDLGNPRKFIIQKDQTDMSFIREVMDKFDLTLRCEDEKVILEEFTATKNEDVTLEWNKTLIKFNPVSNSMNVITDLDVYSYNGQKMEGVKGEKTNSDSQSDDLKLVAEKFGDKKEYMISRDVLDQNDADKIALKILKMNSRKYIYASGTATGDPLIIGGTVIKATGIPKRWDRMYHVIYARHVLRPNRGYITEFNCELYTGKQSNFSQKQEDSSTQNNEKNAQSSSSTPASPASNKENEKSPQIVNLKWKKDDKEIDLVKVDTKMTLCAETKNINDGETVYFEIYNNNDADKKLYRFSSTVRDSKIETTWWTEETRTDKKEEDKLDYIFKTVYNDCLEQSGVLKVRNPEFISVSFDKRAIYYGSEAELKIESFELSEFGVNALVQVWEKDETNPDDFAEEFEISLDGDNFTKTIKFDYPLENLTEADELGEYEFYVIIKIEDLKIEYKQQDLLMAVLAYE